jgi:flavin-binding protein dodecin
MAKARASAADSMGMARGGGDDHVYKMLELTGSSSESVEAAVNAAIARASQTVRNMRWLEVVETRASIENGRVAQWQVMVKIGFRLEGA